MITDDDDAKLIYIPLIIIGRRQFLSGVEREIGIKLLCIVKFDYVEKDM